MALAKYLGRYDEFKMLKERSGLRWTSEKAEDAFLKIYHGGELRGLEDWLLEIKEQCGWSTYFPVTFLFLTGLRTGEGVLSLNKIAENGLDGYLNREQGVLEHFRDKRFIRGRRRVSFLLCQAEW